MKKITLILIVCISVLLIAAAIFTTLLIFKKETKKYSFDRAELDYISDTAYNGTYIVGRDGGFYLAREKEIVSDRYSSIISVNDYYEGDINSVLCDRNANQRIYDLYIAKKENSEEYYLINSAGEKYIISGNDYSIDSVSLPVIVFTNNTNGCKALISIDALNSDLSSFTGEYIYPIEFNSGIEIYTKMFSPFSNIEVCDYIIAKQETDGLVRSLVFSSLGKLVVSSEHLESFILRGADGAEKVFFSDYISRSIYSQDGKLIVDNIEDFESGFELKGNWAWVRSFSNGVRTYTCFNEERVISAGSDKYDISDMVFADGCIYIRDLQEGNYAVFSVFSDEIVKYDNIVNNQEYLLARNQSNIKYSYLSVSGELLFENVNSSLKFNPDISYNGIYVFEEGARILDAPINHTLGKVGGKSAVISIPSGATLDIATLKDNGLTTEHGIFIEKGIDASNEVYQIIHTPFDTVKKSEKYSDINIFKTDGILFAIAASYERGVYDIIDLPANRVVYSIDCEKEDFARLTFRIVDSVNLVHNKADENGAVPVLILSFKKIANNLTQTGTEEYIALFRNATFGNKAFDYASLNAFEFGSGYDSSNTLTSFENLGYFSMNNASSANLYYINDDFRMVLSGSFNGKVHDIITDSKNSEKMYVVTENDTGYQGLCDILGNKIISPYYDEICFVEGENIGLCQNGAYGVIRYLNSQTDTVLNFVFTSLENLGDGIFALRDSSDKYCLYRGSQPVIESDFVAWKTVKNYFESADGYQIQELRVIFAGGEAYTYRIKGATNINRNLFAHGEKREYEQLQNRATLVYYYEGSRLLGKDVIYPQKTYTDGFLNDKGSVFSSHAGSWYYEYSPSEESVAVSREDIVSSEDNFITLYYHKKK